MRHPATCLLYPAASPSERNRRRSPLPQRARRWTARFMSLQSLSISLFGPNKCEIVSKPLYILQDLVTVTSTVAHPENWSRCQLVCWNSGLVTSAISMQLGGLVDAHYASMMCVPKSTLSASDGVKLRTGTRRSDQHLIFSSTEGDLWRPRSPY